MKDYAQQRQDEDKINQIKRNRRQVLACAPFCSFFAPTVVPTVATIDRDDKVTRTTVHQDYFLPITHRLCTSSVSSSSSCAELGKFGDVRVFIHLHAKKTREKVVMASCNTTRKKADSVVCASSWLALGSPPTAHIQFKKRFLGAKEGRSWQCKRSTTCLWGQRH